jgi:hypothetical protein
MNIETPCSVVPSGFNYWSIVDAKGNVIASCYSEEDTKLFCAAPTMLDALKKAQLCIEGLYAEYMALRPFVESESFKLVVDLVGDARQPVTDAISQATQ